MPGGTWAHAVTGDSNESLGISFIKSEKEGGGGVSLGGWGRLCLILDMNGTWVIPDMSTSEPKWAYTAAPQLTQVGLCYLGSGFVFKEPPGLPVPLPLPVVTSHRILFFLPKCLNFAIERIFFL